MSQNICMYIYIYMYYLCYKYCKRELWVKHHKNGPTTHKIPNAAQKTTTTIYSPSGSSPVKSGNFENHRNQKKNYSFYCYMENWIKQSSFSEWCTFLSHVPVSLDKNEVLKREHDGSLVKWFFLVVTTKKYGSSTHFDHLIFKCSAQVISLFIWG